MIRVALALVAAALPAVAGAGTLTLADVCEPSRFRQTTAGLEIYCGAAAPWLTIGPCAKPASARVAKSTYCAGTKYTVVCGSPLAAAAPADDLVAVEDEPLLVAAACSRGD